MGVKGQLRHMNKALFFKRLCRPALVLGLVGLTLSACASLPAADLPPPPPPPGLPSDGPVLRDWRGLIKPQDLDRYQRLSSAWELSLRQAREQKGSGNLQRLGDLIDPSAKLDFVTPPEGDYRCRTVKLGSQSGSDGLGYVIYGWFACRIEATPAGLKLIKQTGSQRPSGLLFPENDQQMVFLGSMSMVNEPPANSYGQKPERDMVAVLERVGETRWRLVIPWPHNESNLDLIELVPAAATARR